MPLNLARKEYLFDCCLIKKALTGGHAKIPLYFQYVTVEYLFDGCLIMNTD